MVASGSFVSTVVSSSLAFDAADVMNNDHFVTALESQIQISIELIGTVNRHNSLGQMIGHYP